jgi:hypothetical protein
MDFVDAGVRKFRIWFCNLSRSSGSAISENNSQIESLASPARKSSRNLPKSILTSEPDYQVRFELAIFSDSELLVIGGSYLL